MVIDFSIKSIELITTETNILVELTFMALKFPYFDACMFSLKRKKNHKNEREREERREYLPGKS